MTNIHILDPKAKDLQQEQITTQNYMNQDVQDTNLSILSNNLSEQQRQEIMSMYNKNMDIKSFLHEFHFQNKFSKNFTFTDLIIENKNSYILDITRNRILSQYPLYNGFGINLIASNLFRDYNQISFESIIKPKVESLSLKNFSFNFKYFIPRGNQINPNLTTMFINNRFFIKDFNIAQKDRKIGIEIIQKGIAQQIYYKYPIYNSIDTTDGNLVYQLKHQYNNTLRNYLKFQIGKNIIPKLKLISQYQLEEQHFNFYQNKVHLSDNSLIGISNYKTLFDQKRFINFQEKLPLADFAIQNNFQTYYKIIEQNSIFKMGFFNLLGFYRNIQKNEIDGQWNIGLNIGAIIQKTLMIDIFWNWNTTLQNRPFMFLLRFENDLDQLIYVSKT